MRSDWVVVGEDLDEELPAPVPLEEVNLASCCAIDCTFAARVATIVLSSSSPVSSPLPLDSSSSALMVRLVGGLVMPLRGCFPSLVLDFLDFCEVSSSSDEEELESSEEESEEEELLELPCLERLETFDLGSKVGTSLATKGRAFGTPP